MMAASSRAVLTGGVAGLLALSAWFGDTVLAAALAAIGVVYAFGWPRLVDVPSKRGSWVVVALATVAALASVWWTEGIDGLAVVVAGGVIASFVHQMARKDGRPRLTETVSTTVTGVLVVTAGVGWLVTAFTGLEVVLLGAAALVAASAATAIPARGPVVGAAATVAATAVGAAVGFVFPMIGPVPGLLLGLVVGVVMALSHLLFNEFPAVGHRRAALAAALMPLLSLGAPVLVLGSFVA